MLKNVIGLWQKLPLDPRADGAHYSIFRLAGDGMEALRKMFPEANADEMNFVLFSTSGCGGTYATIDKAEASKDTEPQGVSFVVIQPRIICIRYGNVYPVMDEDFAFLKALRASSQKAIAGIGF